ncbi:MAG TPA: hypothetical protein VN764_18755, partial [Polyangiaceae bacterium]|nr:hypothetical protein [Polyangiaceae bacterium]
MGTDPSLSISRRRDRVYGLAIIVLAFGGCMGLSVWGMRFSTPRPAPKPLPASPEGITGFPNAVRPFDLVERARGLTVRERFRGFEAKGIQADGTMDVSQAGASLRLAFQSAQGRGPQPVRQPGTLPSRRFCGTQSVILNQK